MNGIAIRVEGLSKRYRIGERVKYKSLRESLTKAVSTPFRRFTQNPKSDNYIWALEDVSFEVKKGEVVGIIGRNGAGKSTILKILSRITEPTKGYAEIHGRVGSLLEVGTGFHPELTGRENIYLNGAILGMTKKEIERKFDEIVDFAEIEKFIDTSVKYYSSGMHMRLAFAVAAHLEPEILLVDEVLAVGDAAFQKKCLGRMGDVAKEGRTVLFISHNMNAVQQLCRTGILLVQGSLEVMGPMVEAVNAYVSKLLEGGITAKTGVGNELVRRGDGRVRFTDIQILNESNEIVQRFEFGQRARFRCRVQVYHSVPALYFSLLIYHPNGFNFVTNIVKRIIDSSLKEGKIVEFIVEVDTSQLRPGVYPLYFWIGLGRHGNFDIIDGLVGPMIFSARGSWEELGFDPSAPVGVVSMNAELLDFQVK